MRTNSYLQFFMGEESKKALLQHPKNRNHRFVDV